MIEDRLSELKLQQWSECEPGHSIYRNGAVGIGTDELISGYNLSVKGGMIAGEVQVELEADWPDYVFYDNYQLLSLLEIEDFVFKNYHLPGFGKDVEYIENGLKMKETLLLQQEKIEEIFLHLIQLNKNIKQLEK